MSQDVGMGLVEWLEAQLDEVERVARAVQDEVGSYRAGEPYEDRSGVASRDAYPSYPWGQSDIELQFMALHDPQSVLAFVAANRAIIELHKGGHECPIGPRLFYGEDVVTNAGWCVDGDCPTLRLLASAYAHREGYLPEWGPR